MKTYQLSPTGKHQAKIYSRIAIAFIVVVAFFPIILAIPFFKSMDFSVSWMYFIWLSILPIAVYFIAHHYLRLSSELQVTIDGNRLVIDRLGRRQTTIEREDVKAILLEEQGIRILSSDPQYSFFIPSGLENFEQFKSDLAIWLPNAEFKTKSLKITLYWVLAGVAFVMILYFTKNSSHDLLFAAALTVAVVLSVKQNFQTILHTKSKWKRYQAIITIPILLCIFALFLLAYAK